MGSQTDSSYFSFPREINSANKQLLPISSQLSISSYFSKTKWAITLKTEVNCRVLSSKNSDIKSLCRTTASLCSSFCFFRGDVYLILWPIVQAGAEFSPKLVNRYSLFWSDDTKPVKEVIMQTHNTSHDF